MVSLPEHFMNVEVALLLHDCHGRNPKGFVRTHCIPLLYKCGTYSDHVPVENVEATTC